MKKLIVFLTFIVLTIIILSIYIYGNTPKEMSKTPNAISTYAKESLKDEGTIFEKVNVDEKDIDNNKRKEEKINKIAEEKNIELDSNTQNTIEKMVKKDLSENDEKKIKEMNMTEEEFRNNLYTELTNMQKRVKLKEKLIKEIITNNISIDNSEFKEKVRKYNENKENNNNSSKECLELLDEYIEILINMEE